MFAMVLVIVNMSCSSENEDITPTDIRKEKYEDDAIAQKAISFVKSLKGTTTRAVSNVSVKNIQKMNLEVVSDTRAANTHDFLIFILLVWMTTWELLFSQIKTILSLLLVTSKAKTILTSTKFLKIP